MCFMYCDCGSTDCLPHSQLPMYAITCTPNGWVNSEVVCENKIFKNVCFDVKRHEEEEDETV